ncbi:Stk1 family PASTA domain-containing Ser/Thr kinase [Kutzneria kofuensis]|uniref:non-specific serine/threonine protein kinase n=2 Tax=Kutzneria kofuensis TaxID=103725 RepID=A0A7W9KHN8_9PSEU|nr:Stk1 family PASTA domain-containing Ser/Thr kinase [Kutzneria kofuensis]MBB5892600.1 serine/threonine-protein kinase [Kutzneria kofuensis]
MSTPRLLSNRYELGETLGYGGMSEVHKGRDVRLGRDVAVKVLRADLARDPQFQERFRREAQNAAALNHPAIVAVYDTGETKTEYGPLPYIVMEYVDGRTLRDIIKTQGPLSGKRAMEVMADVCAALDFSHRHGIIHRDVKPANVMITKTGAVKVMDFGIARAIHDGQAAVTQTAAVIGTAQYLSPEQARGEAVDARSDVYAAGCVLFELMTGQPPFTGDSPVAVAYQHVREEPPAPSSVNPQVTPALDSIVLKAMAKGPANRYQSAAEMRADLVRVLSGQRPSAPAVMTAEDRTAFMGNAAGARTQVVTGRHRPAPPAEEPEYDAYDFEADEEAERKARRKRALTIAGVVLICIAVLALAAWLTTMFLGGNNSGNANNADVPKVEGMQLSAAQAALRDKGFASPQISYVVCAPNSDGTPAPCTTDQIGNVIKQDPPAGSNVAKATTIKLTVGKSPNTFALPDESGKSQEDATKDLQSRKLVVSPNTTTETVDNPDLIGKVSSTNPPVGSQVAEGATITLIIGKGPDQVNVPDETGQPYSVAKSNLEAAGFKVSQATKSSTQTKDQVLDQSPKGGSKAAPNSTVTLTVSLGDQFTMPNLTGLTVSTARSTLQQLGWTGQFSQTEGDFDLTKAGQIESFSPDANQVVGKNQTIQIQVYRGPGGGTTTTTTPPGGGH